MMEFVDMHEDFAFSSLRGDIISGNGQSGINMLREFEKVTIFSVIFPHIPAYTDLSDEMTKNYGFKQEGTYPEYSIMMDQFKFYYYLERSGYLRLVRRYSDINNGINFLISMEGTDVLNQPDDLYILKNLGLGAIGLTWNYDTKFAASCMSRKDYGLTGFGEELINIANKTGIIIDLAHASRKTVLEACALTKAPVIDSHTNLTALKKHTRNIDDEEIKAITETDGIIGITAIPATLNHASVEGIIENINYIGDNYGWRYVGIGTDFLGINDVPAGFENIIKMEELKSKLDHYQDVFFKNPYRIIEKILG